MPAPSATWQLCQQPTATHPIFALQTVSIVFFTDTWRPDSFYHKIVANQQLGLHTLCLLDIQVKEPTLESLARGRKVSCRLLGSMPRHMLQPGFSPPTGCKQVVLASSGYTQCRRRHM